jgi:hypothetical protein
MPRRRVAYLHADVEDPLSDALWAFFESSLFVFSSHFSRYIDNSATPAAAAQGAVLRVLRRSLENILYALHACCIKRRSPQGPSAAAQDGVSVEVPPVEVPPKVSALVPPVEVPPKVSALVPPKVSAWPAAPWL